MIRVRLVIVVLVTIAGASLPGCRPQRGSGGLEIQFSEDGRSWRCEVEDRILVFLDDDNDGLSEACDVYTDEVLLKRVEFDHRTYFREGASYEIPRLLVSIDPDNVVGVNLLIPPKPPFTETPTRAKRVTDREFLELVCSGLNHWSYAWSSVWEIGPDNSAAGYYLVPRFRCALWAGMEIWFRNEPEPLKIMVHHLDNSYDLHEEGMTATWKGETRWFASDPLADVFAYFWTVSEFGEKKQEALWFGRSFSRSERYQPTYFGGIPVGWDGKAEKPVTKPQRIRQVKALLKAYESYLLRKP